MDTDNRLIHEPAERLPALLLAAVATFLIFAAINAGFTPHATHLAERELAAQHALGL